MLSLTELTLLRRRLRRARRVLDARERRQAAVAACAQLQRVVNRRVLQRVALYLPHAGELDTGPLLRWLQRRRIDSYLPVLRPVGPHRLWFVRWSLGDGLSPNRFGIGEPHRRGAARRCALRGLDLIIVPLVGFDHRCNRLGMGGGYYDRTLAPLRRVPGWRRPLLVGYAYEFQRVAAVPARSWDIPLDLVVTDQAVYRRTD